MVRSFEEIAEVARESRTRTSVSRVVAGLKEDIKLKRGFGKSKSQKQILKKPTAKIPSYSATKVVKQLAIESQPMVREVEKKEVVQDNRSQFFNREMDNEMKGVRKWIG